MSLTHFSLKEWNKTTEQNMDLRTIILPQRTLGTVEREPSIKEWLNKITWRKHKEGLIQELKKTMKRIWRLHLTQSKLEFMILQQKNDFWPQKKSIWDFTKKNPNEQKKTKTGQKYLDYRLDKFSVNNEETKKGMPLVTFKVEVLE